MGGGNASPEDVALPRVLLLLGRSFRVLWMDLSMAGFRPFCARVCACVYVWEDHNNHSHSSSRLLELLNHCNFFENWECLKDGNLSILTPPSGLQPSSGGASSLQFDFITFRVENYTTNSTEWHGKSVFLFYKIANWLNILDGFETVDYQTIL